MNWRLITQLLLFDLGWFLAVIGAGRWLEWQIAVSLLMLTLLTKSQHRSWLLLFVAGIGLDHLLAMGQILQFDGESSLLLPAFLIILWTQFSVVTAVLLHRLPTSKVKLALLCGGCGGMGYYLGSWFGAVQLAPNPLIGTVIIGAGWILLFPGLIRFLQKQRSTAMEAKA